MITAGFLYGPQGAPNAQAVTFDPTLPVNAGPVGSVQLLVPYFPVEYSTGLCGEGPGGYRDFGAVPTPYRLDAGRSFRCAHGEAAALIALGAATPL